MKSVYHAGELELQRQAGVSEMARRVGNGIHCEIPPAAQEFLEQQLMAIVGSVDSAGQVWASILTGEPGFIRVLDAQTVQIDASPFSGDPLSKMLRQREANPNVSHEVGLLAIEPATRRRMRLNGTVKALSDGTILLHAKEVYANCPKYIQARDIDFEPARESVLPISENSETLSVQQQEWIKKTDTFFIASAAPNGGADASHRGGNPGFVRVINEATLEFPDYSGNMMFNTLGNITANPNAGLLFLDFPKQPYAAIDRQSQSYLGTGTSGVISRCRKDRGISSHTGSSTRIRQSPAFSVFGVFALQPRLSNQSANGTSEQLA